MMLYAYAAIAADGRRVRGRLEADDPADLERRLARLELFLIRGKPAKTLFSRLSAERLPRRERLWFCFQLRQLLAAGVPLLTALSDLAEAAEHPRLREISAQLARSLKSGQRFSEALAAHPQCFEPVFVSLMQAGEATGDLVSVLARQEAALTRADELATSLKRMLTYPALAGGVMLAACAFLLIYLVPQLQVFAQNMGQTLPWHARALFALGDFLRAAWGWIALGGGLLAGGFYLLWRFQPRLQLAVDGWLLSLPVVGGILKKLVLARVVDTFALLYTAGIPVLKSLSIVGEAAGNRAVTAALVQVETAIRDGDSIADAFSHARLFPPLVTRMARVGETTGALDAAFANVGRFYGRDADAAIARLETLIEPALTLILGALMAWIALSVIGPIYEIVSQIKV